VHYSICLPVLYNQFIHQFFLHSGKEHTFSKVFGSREKTEKIHAYLTSDVTKATTALIGLTGHPGPAKLIH
jgi:hypothetical protein